MRARVRDITADDRALLCDMVLVELWNGARGTKEHRLLRELEEQLETVPTTPEVWAFARELARITRGKGLTVPAADLVIAACADYHRLGLLHQDHHFDKIDQILGKSS